ncbi:hypothetical protein ACFE04_008132 [Oxalis oulophora]
MSTSKNPLMSMDEIKQIFSKFDKNNDGSISADELHDVLASLGFKPSTAEVDGLMKALDKDGNGHIDLDEFVEVFSHDDESDDKVLKDAFDLYDLDGNGVISADELQLVMKRMGEKCSLAEAKKMISSVDEDGDGNVDFEEFKKMMTQPK